MTRRSILYLVLVFFLLSGCNFPLAGQALQATAAPGVLPTLNGPGVQIVSPADGAQIVEGQPITVQFVSAGGPFIEADLSSETGPLTTLALPADDPTPSGTLSWQSPTAGEHTLTVTLFTPEKQMYSASIRVVVAPVNGATAAPTSAAATQDPEREAALSQALTIFNDTYGLGVNAPPLMRKHRPGVPDDPWISVVYVGNWMYALSLYPDHVEQQVAPINMQDDGSVPIPAGTKVISICRPAGTLKILVAFVDYQNLGVTKDQELTALDKATSALNEKFAELSTAGGAASPILQLQTTGVFLSPAPVMTDHLLSPETVKSISGVDPANYDLLIQVDLDANDTLRKINAARNYDTNGFEMNACTNGGLSIWMGLDTVDQALDQDNENSMERLISHELLHTFGYPADHRWPAGDGNQVDETDQSDVFNWPTLMLGWTDTDGDGVPEIIDPTPYGIGG
jgi:hypothetical protein